MERGPHICWIVLLTVLDPRLKTINEMAVVEKTTKSQTSVRLNVRGGQSPFYPFSPLQVDFVLGVGGFDLNNVEKQLNLNLKVGICNTTLQNYGLTRPLPTPSLKISEPKHDHAHDCHDPECKHESHAHAHDHSHEHDCGNPECTHESHDHAKAHDHSHNEAHAHDHDHDCGNPDCTHESHSHGTKQEVCSTDAV